MGKEEKARLDAILVRRGCYESRPQAQRAVRAGWVMVKGQAALKPGRQYPDDIEVAVSRRPPYVSRGGEKLKGALVNFSLKAQGLVCLDVGASTGGFTDCLLQEGAAKVYSLDVGKGQLAWKLRQDPRVTVCEGRNARYLGPRDLTEQADFIVVDVSFISLGKILPALARVVKPDGRILALVKPQFEAGPSEVGRGGVVRDPEVQAAAVQKIARLAEKDGMRVEGVAESVLRGPAGNREFFLLMRKPVG